MRATPRRLLMSAPQLPQDSQHHTSGQAQKRKRIAVACERCRERKIRCDGIRPTCGTCQSRQHSGEPRCIYQSMHNGDSGMFGSDQEHGYLGQHFIIFTDVLIRYIEILHNHIRQLERATGQAHMARKPTVNATDSHIDVESELGRNRGQYPLLASSFYLDSSSSGASNAQILSSQKTMSSNTAAISPNPSTESPTIDSECTISALGAAASTNAESPLSPAGFYGASSAISFFHKIQEALKGDSIRSDTVLSQARRLEANNSVQNAAQLLSFGASARLQDLQLPPRILADYLVDTYWDHVHCLYPLIHKASFLVVYHQLWVTTTDTFPLRPALDIGIGSFHCPTSIFHCALNAIFALGCNFSDLPSGQKRELADTFCQRSLSLALGNLLDNNNLALVQALFILGQYLQSTDNPTRCWNVVGLALRVAQGIGLYMDKAPTDGSLLETEIRRRTWHACLLLDTYRYNCSLITSHELIDRCSITGMTLGRPTLASREANIPLPAAADDIYLEGDNEIAIQPTDLFSQNSFFLQTLKLYAIFDEVLTHVYKPWQEFTRYDHQLDGKLQNSVLSRVVDVEYDLSVFRGQLPVQLRWDMAEKDTGESWILERQRNILHTRFLHSTYKLGVSNWAYSFLHLKVILYRPIFHQLHVQQLRKPAPKINCPTKSPPDMTVMSLVAQRCSRSCIENTQELIAHLSRTTRTKSAGAWWYTNYCKLTSWLLHSRPCAYSFSRYVHIWNDSYLGSDWPVGGRHNLPRQHRKLLGRLPTNIRVASCGPHHSAEVLQYTCEVTRTGNCGADW